MNSDKFRVKSQQRYSYIIKIAQIVVICLGVGMLIFKSCCCEAHVDLHFHSIEWEGEQHMREGREVHVEEWHQLNPDANKEESKEGDERIRGGFDLPC